VTRHWLGLAGLPHPAVVCSGPQLDQVIADMEAGLMPRPDVAVWRGGELPAGQAGRLARATGASEAQIAEAAAEDARVAGLACRECGGNPCVPPCAPA
jgi:hypothetical protein